ncbi:MAG: UDP-N-acetylglucosamine 1-carboxyvinyltransferase [Coriobacteriales bacterium]|jgi:UDP-N-acetylglucosamine 1-carboxyvinyltransferase
MDSRELIVVNGGNPISGTVQIGGAKNSALKLMAACVMAGGESRIDNVPLISDVEVMEEVLETLGAKVTKGPERGEDEHTLFIDTSNLTSYETPYHLVAKMRASISILGPLITRFGRAHVAMPGGCQIGARKLDMHISSLEALGVQFDIDHGFIEATTPDGLKGADVLLEFPSVGATENLMMASVCAEGDTRIRNAACEPEIADLCHFLIGMGAQIEGVGTPNLVIHGVDELHPTEHTTVGDRIEAGTFLVAGALMGGPVTVEGVDPDNLALALKKLQQMGCELLSTENSITVERHTPLLPVDIQTLPHPGFPTDLQAQFMVLASLAAGDSIITENVFENRFMFAAELSRLGADIRIDGHHALISGVEKLSGAPVNSTDLRGGAALVLAGLAAEGRTLVDSIYHIDRGYEDYVGKLRSLGADVARVDIDALS